MNEINLSTFYRHSSLIKDVREGENNRITLLRVNNLKVVDELIEYFKLMNLTF